MADELASLGNAISEAIALKGMVLKLEEQAKAAETKIAANKREIARLNNLEEQTKKLEQDRVKFIEETKQKQGELDARLKRLTEAGVNIPLNDPSQVKGFVNL